MNPYAVLPCPRCGSEQKVSKTWKETVKTFSGEVEVECSQIICTNADCQEEFDKNLAADNKKKAAIRVKREEAEKERQDKKLQLLKERQEKLSK